MLTENHIFREELRVQKVRYILSGKGEEHYIPHFSYFGYRYIRVVGITAGQAKPSLLTMLAGTFRYRLPRRVCLLG